MNLKYIVTFLAVGVLIFSCSDFLKEEPKDQFSIEQYFKDPSQAFSAVTSLYRTGVPQLYDGGVYSGTRMMWIDYMSGFFNNEYFGQEVQIQRAFQLTIDPVNTAGYLDDIWADLYVGISRANNAIKNIPSTTGLETAEQNQLLAEAKFFRAFGYFVLVRMFGPIPLVTEPVTSLGTGLYPPRSSVQEVYNHIVSDLTSALADGGLSTNHMADNEGRITQGAVATLLADVYLTMAGYPLQQTAQYANAAAIAKGIINGQYGTYTLEQHTGTGAGLDPANSAYNKLRISDISGEYIYYKEYAAGISSSQYPRWCYPVALVKYTQYDITNGAFQPKPQFLSAFDPAQDLRIQNKQFYHWTLDTPDGLVTFEPTPYIWHDDAALFVGPPASSKDVAIYTYPDVLLIAAEAIAQSEGVTAEAVDYLSQIKGRAFWKQDVNAIKASLAAMPKDNFVEAVWAERLRELVFQFRTWFDIQRTRKYPVASNANPGTVTYTNVVGYTNSFGSTYADKNLLFPIPLSEIQRNPELGGNNPGY
jgi:hypothetical protein